MDITINSDTTFNAVETIEYDFGTPTEDRHGIYRYLPYKYKTDDGKTRLLKITDISVKNESGSTYNFTKSTSGNNLMLKIGDADKLVTGIKTYITKNPTAADAHVYRKYNAVDAWCSQPFAIPYEQVVSDKKYQYWSYPNHNAGEFSDRVIMQKGGRMTYGYGLWRSGYSTLIPWHWRWRGSKSTPPFNYLADKRVSGCGVRIDKNNEVIPTPYWECFREGYDDLRYLYTLESAVVQRKETTDEKCRALLKDAENLIQKILN